jgi:hypothetical protein
MEQLEASSLLLTIRVSVAAGPTGNVAFLTALGRFAPSLGTTKIKTCEIVVLVACIFILIFVLSEI